MINCFGLQQFVDFRKVSPLYRSRTKKGKNAGVYEWLLLTLALWVDHVYWQMWRDHLWGGWSLFSVGRHFPKQLLWMSSVTQTRSVRAFKTIVNYYWGCNIQWKLQLQTTLVLWYPTLVVNATHFPITGLLLFEENSYNFTNKNVKLRLHYVQLFC